MAYAGGNPAPDLTQIIAFYGYDELYLIDAGLINDTPGGYPYAYMISQCITKGNEMTSALAKNAVVFCEPEWGFDATGGGRDYRGGFSGGYYGGGLSVSW